MPHGKSMDIETVFETCLINSPVITAKDLFEKVRKRGYSLSRAQGYRYGRKFKKAGKLKQLNGIWYYQDPQDQTAAKEKAKKCPSREPESDNAKAIRILRDYEKSVGRGFPDAVWNDVLSQPTGKKMLKKAAEILDFYDPQYTTDFMEPP
jgi:hypothetical protein